MTSSKRKEMQLYRQQAIKLEKRLKRERELREEIKKYSINMKEKCNSTLEHQLTFSQNESVPFVTQPTEFKNENQESCDFCVYSVGSCPSACEDNENKTFIPNVTPTLNEKPIPKLIRSNSYTLESPSPLLVEHLKNLNKPFTIINDQKTITMSCESVSTEGDGDCFLSEREIYENDSNSDPFFTERSIEETDKLNEVFDNNFPANTKESTEKLDSNAKLKEILDNIPENYSKQILELLEKQKLDQENRLRAYYDIKDKLQNVTNIKQIESLNETLETHSSPKSPFSNLENQNFDKSNNCFVLHTNLIENHIETKKSALTCNRKLFVNDEPADQTQNKIVRP